MSSALCASSMYSRLCMKMSSFLFVRAWSMSHILYSSCGIPLLVWKPDNISGLTDNNVELMITRKIKLIKLSHIITQLKIKLNSTPNWPLIPSNLVLNFDYSLPACFLKIVYCHVCDVPSLARNPNLLFLADTTIQYKYMK